MAETKNNMATRFADEVQSRLVDDINAIRADARSLNEQAKVCDAQADVLERQMETNKAILAEGNYEKNGKEGSE